YNQGTSGMARPARLQLAKPQPGGNTQTLFDTGFYAYDGAGNISAIGANRYTYDETSRLLSASVSRPDAVFSADYTYDPFDNLTGYRRTGEPWQYWMVDAKNRQLGKTIDGVNHFYDGAGNLVRAGFQADGISPVWEWTYDALNMQQRYKRTFPDGTFQEYIYLYGPGDLRLMEFDGQTGIRKMTYRNLDGSLLREYEVLGFGLYQPGNPGEVWTHKKDFLHGPMGLIATRTHGGGARFFFADHLGSPRVLTNGLGTLTGKHHYYPYGTEYAPGQDDEQEYKYTGHQRDTHGLSDYMRGRTCAFPLQRFMSVDPGRDGWNLYAYTGGNPVRFVDPTGQARTGAQIAASADARIGQYKSFAVARYTDGTPTGVALATLAGAGADFLKLGTDVLRLGEGLGEAVGNDQLSGTEKAAAVAQDLGRASAIVGGVGSAGGKVLKSASKTLGLSKSSSGNIKVFKANRLKKQGIDPEATKQEIVGRVSAGKFNIGVDDDGQLVLVPVKKGASEVIHTGIPFESLTQ
ncbi:MAG: RHS repeat-associated core domain-containing protein, partial [Acidobacteriota bacterium]|nr:RHS repeat-associated core domain-containing protein [Acidobacteriota bacterium]